MLALIQDFTTEMDIRFDGKRALVTGAGKGIGRGIAIKLASLGAKVHAISRTQADLDSLKQEVPVIDTYNVDISDWDKTKAVVESMGPIDLLVNNASVISWTSFLEVTKEELDNLFEINYKGAFNISQVIAKGMVERGQGGAIVNMSSTGGLRVSNNHTIYCSAEAAKDMLTKTLSLELGPHKIRVNSVNPGLVLTGMAFRGYLGSKAVHDDFRSRTPLQQLAEVEDVVNATVFLLSDKSSMISGIVMPVDGGFIHRV